MLDEKVLRDVAGAHPYPLLFATVSGAHLYGFPSADSDYDLRGAHVLPVRELIGLERPEETLQSSEIRHGVDVDLATHDVRKFLRLLLRPNGYVLEQLYSPLIVVSTAEHQELLHVARGCITRRHVRHYLGFARNQWSLFEKETPRRVKPLLYVYRVLLTGTHLMRTGEVQANLVRLNEHFRLPYIAELIERKVSGAERATLKGSDVSFHRREFERLYQQLDEAGRDSPLPELPTAAAALDDLLIRLRLGPTSAGGNE